MDEKLLKDRLVDEDPEFRRVYALHQECEKELERFSRKAYLSDPEQQAVRELKKKKLALKDRLYAIMAGRRADSDRGGETK